MDGVIFGWSLESQTYIVFTVVLFSFIIFPSAYYRMSDNKVLRIQNQSLWYDWCFIFSMLVYVIFLGYRYDYSFDWMNYHDGFYYGVEKVDKEQGFVWLNAILNQIGFNHYSLFILEALVYVYALFYVLKDNRKIIFWALPLVYMTNFVNCLNVSRQYLAISFLLVGYKLLYEKKIIRAAWMGIIAQSIHYSSILWIPILVILCLVADKIWLSAKIMIGVFILSAVGTLAAQTFFYEHLTALAMLVDRGDQASRLLTSSMYQKEVISLGGVLVTLFKGGLYMYCYGKVMAVRYDDNISDRTQLFLYNIMTVGIIALPLKMIFGDHMIFARVICNLSIFIQFGWGVILYFIFYEKKIRLGFVSKFCCVILTLHYFYVYYIQISHGISMSKNVNLYIQYKDFLTLFQ